MNKIGIAGKAVVSADIAHITASLNDLSALCGNRSIDLHKRHVDIAVIPHSDSAQGASRAVCKDTNREESRLSSREIEVMRWVKMGKTNHEISCILTISVFTVKNHLHRIFFKLDALNRTHAVAIFERTGQLGI